MLSSPFNRSLLLSLATGLSLAACSPAGADSSTRLLRATQTQLMGAPAAATVNASSIRSVKMTTDLLPNDPLSSQQWNLMSRDRFAGAADIFSIDHNGSAAPVVVAVVDSGLRLDHEDYFTLPGYDFIGDPAVANDGDGRDADATDPGDWVDADDLKGALNSHCNLTNSRWHGTAIAGIIGAQSENLTGIAGTAKHVQLLPVRVTGKCGGYVSDLIDGIRWSAGLNVAGVPANPTPARVINLSVGFAGGCSASLQRAINDAVNAGAILVTAATNYAVDLEETPYSPASCNNILTIGANERDGSLASYSSTGNAVFLLGPGGSSRDGIISTDNDGSKTPVPGSSYGFHFGTSLAAAHVSGALATLLSAAPELTNTQLRVALQDSAIPSNDVSCTNGQCGAGLLNTRRAVQLLMNGELPAVDPASLVPPLAAARGDEEEPLLGSVPVTLPLIALFIVGWRRRQQAVATV